MNIAVFTDNFYPEISGISDSAIMTARALAKRGHRVRFFAPRYSKANYRKLTLPPGEPDLGEGISIRRLPSVPFKTGTDQGRAAIPWYSVKEMRAFAPDIAHVHLPYGCGTAGLSAARRLGIPVVGTNHTPVAEFVTGRLVKRLMVIHHTRFFGRCSFVSSPCRAIVEMMQSAGFTRPWEVLPNPVNLSVFDRAVPEALREWKLDLKRRYGLSPFTVLYSGRLAVEKRIDTVIDAVSRARESIPEITLAVAGDGAIRERLKAQVRRLGIDGAVRFFGYVPQETLVDIYHASDVFTMMSRAETQSISVMNAMACGLPVICARAWGLTEYTEGRGILVDVGDSEALAEGLIRLYGNAALRAELGRKGREFVEGLSPEAIAARWEGVYGRVIIGAAPTEVSA